MPEKNNVYPASLGHVMLLEGYLLFSLTIFFSGSSGLENRFKVSKNFEGGIPFSICWISLQQKPQTWE